MVGQQDNLSHIELEIVMLSYHLRRIALLRDRALMFSQQLAPDGVAGRAGTLTLQDATDIQRLLGALTDNLHGANQCLGHLLDADPPALSGLP